MLRVNVFEIKAKLSEYLDRAASGERIVICRHNKPIAELRAVEDIRAEPRPVGALAGRPRFDVPSSFFDPLPDEDTDLWDGGVTAGFSTPRQAKHGTAASTAAEATPRYGTRPRRPSRRRRS
jgi:prevent-host-death family protein